MYYETSDARSISPPCTCVLPARRARLQKHEQDPVDEYHKKMFALLPKTGVLTERRKRKKLTHLEQLDEHSFSVK